MTDQISYKHFVVERKGHVRPGSCAAGDRESNERCAVSENVKVSCRGYHPSVS